MRLTQEKIVIGIGVLLFILPATGFPRSWKSIITAVLGLAVVYLGALIWKKNRTQEHPAERKTGTFTETA